MTGVCSRLTCATCGTDRFGPYFVEPIVAGLDDDGKPYLNVMDLIGCETETDDFVVSGVCNEQVRITTQQRAGAYRNTKQDAYNSTAGV